MLTPDVELVFGVAGEGRADSESYNLIASHLKSITRHLAKNKIPFIQIHIDNKQFTEEIKKIQNKLKELQKTVNIPVNLKEGTGKDSSDSESAKKAKEEKETFNQLKKAINEASKAKQDYYKKIARGRVANKSDVLDKQDYPSITESNLPLNKQRDLINIGYANHIANQETLRDELKKTAKQYSKLTDNARQYIETAKKSGVKNTESGRNALSNLEKTLQDGVKITPKTKDITQLQRYAKAIGDLEAKLQALRVETSTNKDNKPNAGDKFFDALGNKFWSMLSGALISTASRALIQVYNNVVQLDKAVTNLQIATGKTRKETKELVKEYSKLAAELGATTTEVAEAADSWLRQGYSIAETNNLIRNSMMLSKLGQLESAEATRALTSAIKGYKKEVSDAESIVDKFTAVDMKAAIGAGDIATAMAETATSANIAGVSMDTLIGYIATVGEVTQDGSESVGTFFKTLFARMGNIKAGKFVDDDTGETLNDVESVLGSIGISVRNNAGSFRDFGSVLDDISKKWTNLSNIEQHAIATALAGTRQQEKFMVLMENYGSAMNYASIAASSAGTAQQKYQDAFKESIEASLNELTATWQEFSSIILNSEVIKFFIDRIKEIAELLKWIVALGDGTTGTAILIVAAIALITTAITHFKVKFKETMGEIGKSMKATFTNPLVYLTMIIAILTAIQNKTAKTVATVITIVLGLGAVIIATIKAVKKASDAANATNPIGWIITAVGLLIAGVKTLISLFDEVAAYESLKEQAEESKQQWQETNDELAEVQDKIKSITEKIDELKNKGKLSLVDKNELAQYNNELALLSSEEAKKSDDAENKMKKALEDAKNAKNKYGSTHTEQYNSGWKLVGRIAAGVLTLGTSEFAYHDAIERSDTYEEKFNKILKNYSTASDEEKSYVSNYINEIGSLVEGFEYKVGDNISETQKEMNKQLDEYYDLLELYHAKEGNFDTAWTSLFNRVKYQEATESLQELANNVEVTEEKLKELYTNDSDIKGFVDRLIEIGMFAWDDKEAIAGLVKQIRDLSTVSAVGKLSYTNMLDAIGKPFDEINNLLKDVKEMGVISADNIKKLFEENAALAEELTSKGLLFETEDGYSMQEDALNTYLEGLQAKYKQAVIDAETYKEKVRANYGEDSEEFKEASESLENAQENLKAFLTTVNTFEKEGLIEEYTEYLEKMSDGLEEQLDKTEAIYNMRKDLLQSYKEELDYQNELSKKQKSVADLSTKLAIAKLDGSAAGQAKVRELEKELAEAQEELDEYTLDKAISDLTESIDNEFSEYKEFIDSQVKSLTDAIDNAATKSTNELRALLGKDGSVQTHHTGGFVGSPKLKDNEEFAKLLDGELVVTSQQMSKFMNKTLPSIRQVDGNNTVSYNAPLVEINCENVNNETLPQLEKIVDKAVTKVKKEIDKSLSRKGYKKPTDKFAF